MPPIEFVGFSGDCLIRARLTMVGDRLTDMLNSDAGYTLSGVTLESLADGHVVEIDSLPIGRADLFAVVATGPRGRADRRVQLEPHRMQLGLGPYTVLGHLHGRPGADPRSVVMARELMLPLTDATIAFTRAGELVVRDVPALIINREHVDWVVPCAGEEEYSDAPVRGIPFAFATDFSAPALR